ncbi:MAG: galactokinase [Oscillospiraceae bacterium]|jgi:galactokinase|nr:galactokinase [Oscillospiraceae bacterium]
MNTKEAKKLAEQVASPIRAGKKDAALKKLYGADELPRQRARYAKRVERFFFHYGDRLSGREKIHFFSAPGRTEISGNHTDHNLGKVLAASVNLDAMAVVAEIPEPEVHIKSAGHAEIIINLRDPNALQAGNEPGNSAELVRGILAGFYNRGYKVNKKGVGGFVAATASDVPAGSGLSSSAAFEVLVSTIVAKIMVPKINPQKKEPTLIPPTLIAQISQYAEEVFYGKPCGLLDQTTSAVGGCVTIDFKNPQVPKIKKINMNLSQFGKNGYALCIVNTGGDHANLTQDYAAIRSEMVDVATELDDQGYAISARERGAFDTKVLGYMSEKGFQKAIPSLHKTALVGDRAILRAIHFYAENHRVERLVKAIRRGEEGFAEFLATIIESGQSSYMYNQNIYPPGDPKHQPVALGLALSEELLRDCGAWRVHGGGFAGTIQAFVPNEKVTLFRRRMNKTFGDGATYVLNIRPYGGVELW